MNICPQHQVIATSDRHCLYAPEHPAGPVVAKHDGSPVEDPLGGEMAVGLRPELCHVFTADGEAVPIRRDAF